MSSNPWDKFFWNDWENDPALKLCSLAAQGLWMRILCICAKADPKGYLVAAGRSLSLTDLASLVGKSEPEIETLLRELSSTGVSSTDRTGRIYNRRMVRDVKKSRIARENGKLGGNPNLSKQTAIHTSDNLKDKGEDKPHKPEAICQKPEAVASAREEDSNQINRLNRLLGFDETDWKTHAANIRTLIELKADGCDFERHIWPAAEAAAKTRKARSISYLRPRAIELRDAQKTVQSLPTPFEDADARGWKDRLSVFRGNDVWSPKWGPKPGEPGCKVPAEMLERAA